MDEKKISEEIVETAEEVQEEMDKMKEAAEEAPNRLDKGLSKAADAAEKMTKQLGEGAEKFGSKLIGICEPITQKVRDVVLGFGEVIVTISVIIGIVTAIIGGLADMGNIGFFTGLVNMIEGIVGVVMGALVIFLLFAIKKNGDK